MLQEINTIFWDLDGTLIDSEEIHEEAAFAVTREFGVKPNIDRIPAGLENRAVFELLFVPDLNMSTEKTFIEWENKIVEYAILRINKLHQIKQSVELFNTFAQVGLKQSVVSNSKFVVIEHSLKELGILAYCNQIFSRDEVENGKPNPELYLRAIGYHNQKPANCLAFEDSYSGITAAKAAGLAVVGVGKASSRFEPNQVCLPENKDWLNYLQNYYCFTAS